MYRVSAIARHELAGYEPMVELAVRAGRGDVEAQRDLEPHLAAMEKQETWRRLDPAMRRVLDGERADDVLTDLAPVQYAILRQILDGLAQP